MIYANSYLYFIRHKFRDTCCKKKFFITLILNYAIKRFITIIIIELFWLIFLYLFHSWILVFDVDIWQCVTSSSLLFFYFLVFLGCLVRSVSHWNSVKKILKNIQERNSWIQGKNSYTLLIQFILLYLYTASWSLCRLYII